MPARGREFQRGLRPCTRTNPVLEWLRIASRRAMKPSAATRADFPAEVAKIFRDLYPLYRFTSQPDWKP